MTRSRRMVSSPLSRHDRSKLLSSSLPVKSDVRPRTHWDTAHVPADRYTPLPSIEHKLPFLTTIQLPLLMTYHSRISGSLDAFETLSSAFVRAVPGALSGNVRGGLHVDQARLTGGVEGLGRLVKASLSAQWTIQALRDWADDIVRPFPPSSNNDESADGQFFVEMSEELRTTPSMRWKIQSEPLLHNPPSENDEKATLTSVWDLILGKYTTLADRAEDMVVRLITAEVESDLKKHLQRYVPPRSLACAGADDVTGDGTKTLPRQTKRPTRPSYTP